MDAVALRSLLDILPTGSALLDRGLRFSFTSRAFEGLLSVGRERLDGALAVDILGEEAAPLLEQALAGETATQTLRVRPRIGPALTVRLRYRPRHVGGSVAGVLVAASMSEDAAAQARARAEQEQEEVQRIARIGTYHTDLKAGTWTASEGLCRIFGFEPGGVYTTDEFESIVHPEELADVMAHFGVCIAERRPFDLEYRCIHRITGAVLDVRSTSQLLYDDDGNPDRIVGIKQDITERKQLQRRFEAAQRMEAVGRLAGGIAHDFNNVLTAIMGYSELATLALPPGSRGRVCVDRSLDASHRARDLVQKLLAFSRRRTVSPMVQNLNETVRGVFELLTGVIGDDVRLRLRLEDALWNARIDRTAMEQILVNLAVNARDAMPSGGAITLETTNVVIDRRIEVAGSTLVPGEYVQVTLADEGGGMDEATRARACEPFFSTKPEGHGTGLGLATCSGLVAQAGGCMAIYSEVGHGTTVRVYLPRHDAAVEPVSEDAPAPPEGGTERVLVVEDDASVLTLVEEVLRDAGYAVTTACDGEVALEILSSDAPPFDLLLSDVVMPNLGGRELEAAARARLPGLRVLFMSGFSAAAFADRRALPAGTQLLEKPFTHAALLSKVRAVLDG